MVVQNGIFLKPWYKVKIYNLKQIQVDERWGVPPTKQCEQCETKPWHAIPLNTGWFIGILILAYDNPFVTG